MSSHVSEELKRNVEDLRAWLQDYIEGDEGQNLSVSAFRAFNRCRKVCDDLLDGKVAIPPYWDDDRIMTLPDMKSNRRAVFRVMILKYLNQLMQAFPEHRHWFLDRVVALSSSKKNPGLLPVLMPDSKHGKKAMVGGFMAHEAKEFFEGKVRTVLARLDDMYPYAEFQKLAPEIYDHLDPDNVARWGHAWTQASAAVATNWLQNEGGNTIDGVVQVMLNSRSDSLVPPRRGTSTLPSDHPDLRIELRARPLLCQVMHHNPKIGDAASEVVYLKPKYIGSEPSAGVSQSTGRGLIDIYFTAWIESFATQLVDKQQTLQT